MTNSASQIAVKLLESYASSEDFTQHLDRQPLPSTAEIVRVIDVLQELMFPGFFGTQGLSGERLLLHVTTQLSWLQESLSEQIRRGCAHAHKIEEPCAVTDKEASEIAATFLSKLPQIREILATDVDAAYIGDPAAMSKDEVVSSYPSLFAVMTYRLAHELNKLKVPLVP
ncbi:MAG: serine acetyltransferase, partial [Pyrinomonadaceae bacterium]|nr:serine acetyltransferase [Pyrinomonadaceae bacterium]